MKALDTCDLNVGGGMTPVVMLADALSVGANLAPVPATSGAVTPAVAVGVGAKLASAPLTSGAATVVADAVVVAASAALALTSGAVMSVGSPDGECRVRSKDM